MEHSSMDMKKEDGTADEDSDGILVKVNVKTGETKLLMSQSFKW